MCRRDAEAKIPRIGPLCFGGAASADAEAVGIDKLYIIDVILNNLLSVCLTINLMGVACIFLLVCNSLFNKLQ